METTPRTLNPEERDRNIPRTWTGKLETGTHQGKDMTASDMGTCPFLGVLRLNPHGLVNINFRSRAVTPGLNFCSAACRGCEFHQGMGKPQTTGVLSRAHTIHVVTASALLSPGMSTNQHRGWQGPQVGRARRASYLLGSSQSITGLLP